MTKNFWTRALGICLIGAPLLTLVSAIVCPPIKHDEAAQLAAIAEHPARYYTFTIFTWAGIALLVPALIGLMYMVRERAPAWGNAGGTLAIAGSLIAIGDAASQLVIWQMAARGADRAEMAALLKRFDDTLGSSLVFSIGGLAFLAGSVILGIGLYRSRAVPAWVAAGFVTGGFLNIVGFESSSVAILVASSVVLLAALGWIGWRMLADRDRAALAGEALSGARAG